MKMESFAEVALGIEVATAVTKGAREYQQDSVLTNFPSGQDNGYAIIADGMGGSTDGQMASTLATCSVFEHLKMNAHKTESGASMPTVLLREAAAAANKRIADHVAKSPKTAGMGTTLLVPWIQGNKLFWLSIGDSPFMLFRDGALRMLNQDHSLGSQIDMMIKVGTMDPEEGKDHPDRSLLTSALEGKEIALIDCPPVPIALQPGDVLVAATDGLQFLPNAVIANTLMLTQNGSSMDTANALLNSLDALNDPEQDNAAIVVIKVGLAVGRSTSRGADDIPVLALAEGASEPQVAAAPEPEAAAPVKKKKTFFYRGQEYEKDD